MNTFAFKEIEQINGLQSVLKLVIDDKCQFDEYIEEITGSRYESELGSLLRYMQFAADGEILPSGKERDITPKGEIIKETEFRSKNLRIYTLKTNDGKLVVLGGYKNRQPKDLRRLRSIKKRLLEAQKL